MADEYEATSASVPGNMVINEERVVTMAVLQINLKTMQIGLHWLPELFCEPLPKALRKELVEKLRHHADMLESGILERDMRKFITINDPQDIH